MVQIRCACGKHLKVTQADVGKAMACKECECALRLVAPGLGRRSVKPTGVLVIRRGPHRVGEQIFLAGDMPIQVGKLPGSDILLQGNGVSRTHCRLAPTETGWRIEDEASTNGTSVNGRRIEGVDLFHGDRVIIGDFRFKYLDPNQATATAVAPPRPQRPPISDIP